MRLWDILAARHGLKRTALLRMLLRQAARAEAIPYSDGYTVVNVAESDHA